jgi:hypothetical protein
MHAIRRAGGSSFSMKNAEAKVDNTGGGHGKIVDKPT